MLSRHDVFDTGQPCTGGPAAKSLVYTLSAPAKRLWSMNTSYSHTHLGMRVT